MGDPFRPPLWRRGWVAMTAAFFGIAAFFTALSMLWIERREALLGQPPEIIFATYLGTGAIVERRIQPSDNEAVFVRLEDGSQRMFPFSGPSPWLEGCEVGGPIQLERRGLGLSLARSPCAKAPTGRDGASK